MGVKATGDKGDKGDDGAQGATGAQGPQGEKGEDGKFILSTVIGSVALFGNIATIAWIFIKKKFF